MSAAFAEAIRPRGGRSRLVLAVLVLSLVLNLFFIAGALWIRLHQPSDAWGRAHLYERMASELGLDPQQRAGFDRYVAAMRTRTAKMREQAAPLMAAAWDEVGKPQAREAEVLRLMDEAAEKRREFQHEATSQTLAFLALLSPAQRTKFVALSRESHDALRHHSPYR